MGDDELRIQVTPENYRNRSILTFVVAAALIPIGWLYDLFHRDPFRVWIAIPVVIGVGIYFAVQARRQVTTPLLVMDRDGWRIEQNDGFQHSWHGVIMIWVGSVAARTGVSSQVLVIYTRAGVDFARRLGSPPRPRDSVVIDGDYSAAELCERLERWTTAEIVDGSQVSRREAVRRLTDRHRAAGNVP